MTPIGMKTGDDEEYNNGDNDDYEMEGEGWNNPYFLPKYFRQLINIFIFFILKLFIFSRS